MSMLRNTLFHTFFLSFVPFAYSDSVNEGNASQIIDSIQTIQKELLPNRSAGRKAVIEGIVSYVSPEGDSVRIHDANGFGIAGQASPSLKYVILNLPFSCRVRMTGHTRKALDVTNKRNEFELEEIEVLETGVLLVSKQIKAKNGEIVTNLGDYVHINGVVKEVYQLPKELNLVIRRDGRTALAKLAIRSEDNYEHLLGKTVRIKGVLGKLYDSQDPNLAYRLNLMSESQIEAIFSMKDKNQLNKEVVNGVIDGQDVTSFIVVNGKVISSKLPIVLGCGRQVEGYRLRPEAPAVAEYVYLRTTITKEFDSLKTIDPYQVARSAQPYSRIAVTGFIKSWSQDELKW